MSERLPRAAQTASMIRCSSFGDTLPPTLPGDEERSTSDELTSLLCSVSGGSRVRLASLTPKHLALLNYVRATAVAADLRSGIQAATGQPAISAEKLVRDHEFLRDSLLGIGHAFVRGARPGETTNVWLYDDLMQAAHADAFPLERIGRLAQRFDPDVKNGERVIDLLRRFDGGKIAQMHGTATVSAEQRPSVYAFADALDGAYEDVERLKGRAAEFRTVDELGLGIDDYRKALTVPDDLEIANQEIVFFTKT